MKNVVSLAILASLVVGCATPAGMVSKRDVSAGELQSMKGLNCADLATKFEGSLQHESRLAAEMNKRAGAQLAANVIGVAALAVGGIGFFYTVRNEGSNREALSNARGELEAMRTAGKETNCDLSAVENRVANPVSNDTKATEIPIEPKTSNETK
jgi:hypothetical protein